MSDADDLVEWLIEHDVANASKQLMIDSGLNAFGFDLAMESFHRLPPKVADVMPDIFTYQHEKGLLIFVKRGDDG